MEIALYIFAAIGAAAVLLLIYMTAREIHDNSTEIDNLKHWHRGLDTSVDKAHDRYYDLSKRVEELEDVLSGRIADVIETKTRRRK